MTKRRRRCFGIDETVRPQVAPFFFTNGIFASRDRFHKMRSSALGLLISMCGATQERAQRNQTTPKLATSKFANWILCFRHIRSLAMGKFNQGDSKHHESKTVI